MKPSSAFFTNKYYYVYLYCRICCIMGYQLWRKPIMNTSLNITAFNYQNEIKMANTLFDQDEDAGGTLFKKASAKNKSQK